MSITGGGLVGADCADAGAMLTHTIAATASSEATLGAWALGWKCEESKLDMEILGAG
jgi:hypothetical protein